MNKKVKCLILLCLAACVTIVLFACSCGGKRLTFNASFYFVCYKSQDDAHSASSVSGAVQSLGGAGYVISYGGKYYLTFACYYEDREAQSVCSSLKKQGLDCEVLNIRIDGYPVSQNNSSAANEYYGCLDTLCQIAGVMYNTANALAEGLLSQQGAKGVISASSLALRSLYKNSALAPFKSDFNYILSEMEEAANGFVYARDVRALQVALCDCVINAQFA